jgi:hypothetical protein
MASHSMSGWSAASYENVNEASAFRNVAAIRFAGGRDLIGAFVEAQDAQHVLAGDGALLCDTRESGDRPIARRRREARNEGDAVGIGGAPTVGRRLDQHLLGTVGKPGHTDECEDRQWCFRVGESAGHGGTSRLERANPCEDAQLEQGGRAEDMALTGR